MTGSINFFTEDLDYRIREKRKIRAWILDTIRKENILPGEINIIFCNDSYLAKLNRKYLKRNTLTDIITFSFGERDLISGDLFISLDRVRENAKIFGISLTRELSRVMIHGILHLAGYDDQSEREVMKMRMKEDFYLQRLEKLP